MNGSKIDFSKPIPTWERFRLDSEDARTIRLMLNLDEDEDMPRTLLLAMAVHQALVGHQFATEGYSPRVIASLAMYAHVIPTLQTDGEFHPGQRVKCKSLQIDALYVIRGPLGRELINSHGSFYLVKADDLTADRSPAPKMLPADGQRPSKQEEKQPAVRPQEKADLEAALAATEG